MDYIKMQLESPNMKDRIERQNIFIELLNERYNVDVRMIPESLIPYLNEVVLGRFHPSPFLLKKKEKLTELEQSIALMDMEIINELDKVLEVMQVDKNKDNLLLHLPFAFQHHKEIYERAKSLKQEADYERIHHLRNRAHW